MRLSLVISTGAVHSGPKHAVLSEVEKSRHGGSSIEISRLHYALHVTVGQAPFRAK